MSTRSKNYIFRKFLTDIVRPLEEELIMDISQKFRARFTTKLEWSRTEILDVVNEVIQEVRDEQRKSPDPGI
jgi:hypothetical protein